MGRSKSHNKSYISHSENIAFGGKAEGEKKNAFRPLPFYCCSLSLQHLDDPMSNDNGNLFDIVNLMPFIKKYNRDPITNKQSTMKDYFRITFHKNEEDEYHCPILKKVFTDFTHIVVIRTTGNVYSYDAVQKLNIEAKNWKDLITDEPFTKSDIIVIQDPVNRSSKNNISDFHFVKQGIEFTNKQNADGENNNNNEVESNVNLNDATSRIFKTLKDKGIPLSEKEMIKSVNDKLEKEKQQLEQQPKKLITEEEKKQLLFDQFKKEKREKEEAVKKHAVQAPSFTSTGFTRKEFTELHPSQTEGKKTKKKGYVQLKTNLGDLNIQLHCDLVPKACENFLRLAETGYYNGVTFHRLIKNFMIQGGDPTGTGSGGESIWKRQFKDEFKTQSLQHSERGILSMANSGSNTNGSQFFITFRAVPHLDNKHTVFGKLVGGLDILKAMELVRVDENDKPIHNIKITAINIFENPFNTLDEEQFEEKLKEEKKQKQKQLTNQQLDKDIEGNQSGSWYSNPTPDQKVLNSSKQVGKYLPTTSTTSSSLGKRTNELPTTSTTTTTSNNSLKESIIQEQQKKSKTTTGYGNFSGW